MASTLNFTVIGAEKINCSACETRIGFALKRLLGVKDVQASAQTQQVSVMIDPAQITPEEVETTLGKIGYEVRRR